MGKIQFSVAEVDNGYHLSICETYSPFGMAGTTNVTKNLVYHSMREVMEAILTLVSDRL